MRSAARRRSKAISRRWALRHLSRTLFAWHEPPSETPRALEALAPGDGRAAFVLDALVATSNLTTTGVAALGAPNVLSLTHWDRLLEGELYASSSRLDWRTLLKRTFDVDLRVCVRCGGRLTVRAVVTAPAAIAKRLAALRRPRAPPAAA